MSLKETYKKTLAKELKAELGLKSIMAVPRLQKITLNIGLGKYLAGSKDTNEIETHLANIAGQKGIITRAKKAISNFKTRQGMAVGLAVTLRGDRAWNFLEKFINVSAPRIRDFRGFSPKSFDGNGNYSLGLKDIQIFPEVHAEKITKHSGMQITLSFSGNSDENSRLLMDKIQFPFIKKTNK